MVLFSENAKILYLKKKICINNIVLWTLSDTKTGIIHHSSNVGISSLRCWFLISKCFYCGLATYDTIRKRQNQRCRLIETPISFLHLQCSSQHYTAELSVSCKDCQRVPDVALCSQFQCCHTRWLCRFFRRMGLSADFMLIV